MYISGNMLFVGFLAYCLYRWVKNAGDRAYLELLQKKAEHYRRMNSK